MTLPHYFSLPTPLLLEKFHDVCVRMKLFLSIFEWVYKEILKKRNCAGENKQFQFSFGYFEGGGEIAKELLKDIGWRQSVQTKKSRKIIIIFSMWR
jgi:hypothetical protein